MVSGVRGEHPGKYPVAHNAIKAVGLHLSITELHVTQAALWLHCGKWQLTARALSLDQPCSGARVPGVDALPLRCEPTLPSWYADVCDPSTDAHWLHLLGLQ